MPVDDQLREQRQVGAGLFGLLGPMFDRVQILLRISQQTVNSQRGDSCFVHGFCLLLAVALG